MLRSVPRNNNFCPENFALLLRKCLDSKSSRPSKQIHALLLMCGTNMNLLSLHSKLVGLYASSGDLKSATQVFKRIQKPNTFALNWMVLGHALNGHYAEAIRYVSLMQSSVKHLNEFTFTVLLKVCVGLGDLYKGKQVHCLASVTRLENQASVANALLHMYCKCGSSCSARKVFDGMTERNVVSWTSMIRGYCDMGDIEEGISLFERMKFEGIQPNEFTWNALIGGCARCGESTKAFEFISRMSTEAGLAPDLVTWNSMILGCAQSHKVDMALSIFRDMLDSRIRPNEVTVTGLLMVCGLANSIHRGREIHGVIYRMGLDIDPFVATALIDMYAKCASVTNARTVFDATIVKNVATWNAMIGCYVRHESVALVLELFGTMCEMGISPNEVTFASVLSACSHAGHIEGGLGIFKLMNEIYNVEAKKEHYACVVDMLCRAGRLEEAYRFMKEKLPMDVGDSMVGAFFNGCQIHRRKDLAEMMAKEILGMDLNRPGMLVILSNIYAAEGEWDQVLNVRKIMRAKEPAKEPGFSWLQGTIEYQTTPKSPGGCSGRERR